MSNKLTVKYIGTGSTLVRSFGKKVEIKKGKSVEVTEQEYNNLRATYKNIFEFSKSEDQKKDAEKKAAQARAEEVVEETVEEEETTDTVEETVEEDK